MRRLLIATGLTVVLSCSRGGGAPDPNTVVAEIGTHRITLGRVQDQLRANLLDAESTAEEGPPSAELDRARSRLFDELIDEELIFLEAESRGFQAGPEEIDAYLAEFPPDADTPANATPAAEDRARAESARREAARRAILIDKFRDAWLRSVATIGDAEIEERVKEAKERIAASWTPAARVMGYHDEETATRERDAFLRSRAALARLFETPAELPDPEDLPEEARTALESLGAGGIAGPFAVGAGFAIVVKQPRPTGAAWTSWIRERARAELLGEASERESARLLAGLRARTKVKLHANALPFQYR